ncbi:serine/threonine-protein kinase [Streptomyces sp. PR69]|uniref:serine/threonine-protein kinase n=1 Tax=Streptomyces sp. PR69 TaxID=2984950 RepID=UPI002264A2BF|nr:serine/threonine-protein kinase [Streptomyces sp. PR69]
MAEQTGAVSFLDVVGALDIGGLAVIGAALVLRLASLPLLSRAQEWTRRRALAVPGADATPRGIPAVVFGEAAVWLLGGAGLWLLMASDALLGFDLLIQPVASPDVLPLSVALGIPIAEAHTQFLIAAAPALVLWPLLYLLTQRNLLTGGVPARAGASSPTGLRLAGLFALRVVLAAFLPVGLVLAALLFEAVAAITSWRLRSADGRRHSAGGSLPPAAPAQPVPAAAPQMPPVPSFPPAQAVAYVPTQADPGAAPQVAHRPLHPNEPRTIGGYQLLGRIGAGGMGTVYLARREGAATQVALKTINPELLDHAELLRRFEREAEVLALVSGAYTARVLDAGVDAGRPYLVMELLDGRPLDAHLHEKGPIRTPEALRSLALALAVALSGVHRLGLVHRDLKPANIMLTTAGPRLLDFGIAAIVDGTRLTRTGGGPGTLTYMAPEQFGEERIGPAADVWAWACCVVCAAHGDSPFTATSTGAVIRRIVETGPEPASLEAVRALDPALAAAVGQALAIDPEGRPADGAALVSLLTAHHGPTPTLADANSVREQITHGWRTLAL